MEPQPTRDSARSVLTSAGIAAAAVLLAVAAAAPAFADGRGGDGDHADNGNHYGQAKDQGDSSSSSGTTGRDSETHNPPGNNGTVKIHDVYGDIAHHNVPHVDCDFAVAFWGFDQSQTLDVSFAGQAPTGKDTALTVTGASTSITSPDDAGGGQDYDGELDFRADQLNLSSLGAPHPKQGYHIKLTVNTYEPGGHKYKVFWLQPCTQAPTTPTESGTDTGTDTSTQPTGTTPVAGTDTGTTSSGQQPTAVQTSNSNQSVGATSSAGIAGSTTSPAIPTQVLGRSITRGAPGSAAAPAAAALPFTGAAIRGLAALAVLLLTAGMMLTVAGRRRRRA